MSELTVADALKELREMWPDGSFKIAVEDNPHEEPTVRLLVLRRQILSVHQPTASATTLTECMAQVRAWKEPQ